MKYTSRNLFNRIAAVFITALLCLILSGCSLLGSKEEELTPEQRSYLAMSSYEADYLYPDPYSVSNHLCVTSTDVSISGYEQNGVSGATGLFDVTNEKVLEANGIFTKQYPASTTKLMTCLLALKMCDMDEIITVSPNLENLDKDSSVAGLKVGDQVTVLDMLYALMLASGNDAALALAEHIAGSEESFAALMNDTAEELLCTGTHFVNSHGLHDEEHYTTAYDLYLIFNECIKYDTFNTIIDTPSYTGTITRENGSQVLKEWEATNYYFKGIVDLPSNVTVMGGKTGTTDEAGACLVLLSRDNSGNPYISVVLNADNKTSLYREMTELMEAIPES